MRRPRRAHRPPCAALRCALDSYTDDLELTRRHEWGWQMFATMAEKVFDLARETVRP